MPDPTGSADGGAMTRDRCAATRTFRIWVDGRLSARFADGLTGVGQRDEKGATVLEGAYVDESHLNGLLDHLRALGIGVRRFEVDDARSEAAEQPTSSAFSTTGRDAPTSGSGRAGLPDASIAGPPGE